MYSIDWLPVKVGTYDIDVKYGDLIPVWGSPMKVSVYDSTKVKVERHWTEPAVNQTYMMKGESFSIVICPSYFYGSIVKY